VTTSLHGSRHGCSSAKPPRSARIDRELLGSCDRPPPSLDSRRWLREPVKGSSCCSSPSCRRTCRGFKDVDDPGRDHQVPGSGSGDHRSSRCGRHPSRCASCGSPRAISSGGLNARCGTAQPSPSKRPRPRLSSPCPRQTGWQVQTVHPILRGRTRTGEVVRNLRLERKRHRSRRASTQPQPTVTTHRHPGHAG